ncbi:MAG: hypothetical protein IT525_10185 [Nitrosomonas sp.]|nr:hypothetical protein [Nitrosomonas sp.]
MISLDARSFRKAEFVEKPHETAILSKENLVAGARSDLALGHNIVLRKDKMVAGVHNHLNLLFSAIGLSERSITI